MPYHMHYHPTSSQIAFCFVAAPRYDDRDWGGTSRAIPAIDQLSPELRQLLKEVPCSDTRHSCSRPRRSREMWLTDDEPRRIDEIFDPLPEQLNLAKAGVTRRFPHHGPSTRRKPAS